MTLRKTHQEVMFNKHQEMCALATLWSRKVLFIFLALTFMIYAFTTSNSHIKQIQDFIISDHIKSQK